MMIVIIGLVIEMACIVAVAWYLNKKIDAIDEAIFQHMKDEHNARMEDCIPRDYYEKVVGALTEKHTNEIAELTDCAWK